MVKLINTFYFNKKLKQQNVYGQRPPQYAYGSEIRIRQEEPDAFKAEKKKIPSFSERLDASGKKTKEYFGEILAYCDKQGIKHTVYRNKVKFFAKNRTIANLYFTHKTLRICLALNPANFDPAMLKFRDFSGYAKHSETPMSVLLNSRKSVENCKILVFKALYHVA
ncbi:MAG TPA: hypothetical protein PKY53_00985 [Clostridia bacterium]|nr:hypothetical protein [Clostridia bacterium]